DVSSARSPKATPKTSATPVHWLIPPWSSRSLPAESN
ncbi:uncharacterized protein METZ01_LOCUS137813, partial [marine metagenome]